MKRREFIFRSAKGFMLLHPLLSLRYAQAQAAGKIKRVLFVMQSNGYSSPADMFPTTFGSNFTLPPNLSLLQDLRQDMVIINNVNIRDSGPNPQQNHLRSVGKIFTAKDIVDLGAGGLLPNGPSIDQVIADNLNLKTVHLHVNDTVHDSTLYSRPFARRPRQMKNAEAFPAVAWDLLFSGATAGTNSNIDQVNATIRLLNSRKSMLDDLVDELKLFRKEVTGDEEKMKLDIHEDAIRRAELAIGESIQEANTQLPPPSSCQIPVRQILGTVPVNARAHLDMLFAAFTCNRVQVAGLVWGWSGYQWNYNWVAGTSFNDHHLGVAHTNSRINWLLAQQWDWNQIGGLVRRLKAVPEGNGTMLDSTIVVVANHFGSHHGITQVPFVLFGGRGGGLVTGRSINAGGQHNDKVLTSVAHYMGANIAGIGDNPNCGPLPGL